MGEKIRHFPADPLRYEYQEARREVKRCYIAYQQTKDPGHLDDYDQAMKILRSVKREAHRILDQWLEEER